MGRRGWVVLLALATLAAVALGSQHRTLSYEEAVSLAVDFYNQGPGIDHAFRLLRADPQPAWDMTSQPRQELRFVVRETVCPRAQDPPASECDFQDNGLVRNCTGLFSTEQESPTVIITCDTVTPGQHARVRRSGWWDRIKRRRGSDSRLSYMTPFSTNINQGARPGTPHQLLLLLLAASWLVGNPAATRTLQGPRGPRVPSPPAAGAPSSPGKQLGAARPGADGCSCLEGSTGCQTQARTG